MRGDCRNIEVAQSLGSVKKEDHPHRNRELPDIAHVMFCIKHPDPAPKYHGGPVKIAHGPCKNIRRVLRNLGDAFPCGLIRSLAPVIFPTPHDLSHIPSPSIPQYPCHLFTMILWNKPLVVPRYSHRQG